MTKRPLALTPRLRLLRVRGHSMQPTLAPGWTVAVDPLASPTAVRVGDIVAARRADGHCVIHRVVALPRRSFVTQGDGCTRADRPWAWPEFQGTLRAARAPGGQWLAPRAWEKTGPLLLRRARRGARLKVALLRLLRSSAWYPVPIAPTPRKPTPGALAMTDPRPPRPAPSPSPAAPHVEAQPLGDELLLHNTRTGDILALNATAILVWEALSRGEDQQEAVRLLARAYPAVPEERIARDVATTADQISRFLAPARA